LGRRDPVERAAYVREWRARDPEEHKKKRREYMRAWISAHPEKRPIVRARALAWGKANPGRLQSIQYRWKLMKKYGVDFVAYSDMVVAQLGRCAVCREPDPDLCLDHNHRTGGRRGLLCRRCNGMLGLAGDSLEVLGRAIAYLGGFSS
jgi:hypothetical protein